jgi:hypothetical protein
LGRLVLMLFALATASAGAAPCFAMSAAAPASQQSHEVASVAAHDHARVAAHEHAANYEPAAAGGEHRQPHDPCPHCPLGAAANAESASHAHCAANDDASDAAKPTGSPPASKHVFATAQLQLLPEYRPPRLRSALQASADAALSSIALNLRHCVLLI